ncbi:MAG TPA: hypothetical protein VES89_01425 [Candidatus Competibacteraceae bacterium]|nr:hypothetical protein [Candidatus Competibacteraceae bacterium]
MSQQTLNDQTVDVAIIAADGATLQETLTPREAWTVQAVDAVLKQNAEFQAAYPGATLVRVESNRGVADNRQGRYYLRYQSDHGATEFWGYLSRQPTFDFKKGIVGVVATPHTPAKP